jgi:predicted Fe-Mo cluster-binding NifX family protein
MKSRILIPLYEEDVAPRFDLATEVLIVALDNDGLPKQERVLILPGPSAEQICHLVVTEAVDTVICGAIEAEYYDYLVWKRVQMIDNVIGSYRNALARCVQGCLQPGDIIPAVTTAPPQDPGSL